MLSPHSKSIRSVNILRLFKIFICTTLLMFFNSCGFLNYYNSNNENSVDEALTTKYSIVFVIHGDGDYLYHDSHGKKHTSDNEILKKAKRIAKQNPEAEVFIFHQKPKKNRLFVFPVKDGEFFYYRNGKPIANKLYWRGQEQRYYDNEVELYEKYKVQAQHDVSKIFLYFGHEIPGNSLPGYDASYPERIFSINNFANGLNKFIQNSSKFDLIILSTCYGGTPYTIGKLTSYAKLIIASPENLHLSHFDILSLERLDLNYLKKDTHAFAVKFAYNAFERLSESVNTAISVAVYDAAIVNEYISSVNKYNDSDIISYEENSTVTMSKTERCDCFEIPNFRLPGISNGVNVFYRSPLFGRAKNKINHSGWECLKITEAKDN